ncbi:hypothetical protein [Streptomyces sp. NPDC058812]|uniref:hypothetical protein n=1 Tax=unclassified Streptomyces TaxID=2593676 RepID=UPI0036C68DDF
MGTIWCDVPFSAVGGRRHELLGDAGLQCSDAPAGEAGVVSGGREALAEAFVVVRQRADLTAQGHVGGGDSYDVGICPVLPQLGDLAQEFGDALALVGNLGVGGFEGIFRSVVGADIARSLRYAVAMRYAQGGGLTPQGQAARERVRMLAADGFVRGEKNTVIAKELRVSVRTAGPSAIPAGQRSLPRGFSGTDGSTGAGSGAPS